MRPEEGLDLQSSLGNQAFGSLVNRRAPAEQDGPSDAQPETRGGLLPPIVGSVPSGDGTKLPEAVRREMEAAFGEDLSEVRVHTGPDARQATSAIDAAAYTLGQDIVAGVDRPEGSASERHALAHELTHVVQQRDSPDEVEATELGSHEAPEEQEATDVADELAPASAAPGHSDDPTITAFQGSHPSALLRSWQDGFGERPTRVSTDSALGTVRRMGRAEGPSPRQEELERVRTTDDDTYIRDVLVFFYPDNAGNAPINEDAQRLAAALLWDAIRQSRAIDLVPRPAGRPTAGWVLKEAVQIAFRYGQDQGIYDAVRKNVASRRRSALEELRNGIPVTL